MSVYRRRVQLVAGSTLSITLPKDWARIVGIKPGTELTMKILPDGSLLIYPPSRSDEIHSLRAVVEPRSCSDLNSIAREILSYYLAGFHEIRVIVKNCSDEDVKRLVHFIHEKVLGLELLDEDAESITFQNVVDPESLDLNSSLKRLTRVAISMLNDLVEALKRRDRSILENLVKRDDIVDKLYLLILRRLIEDTTMISNRSELRSASQAIYVSMTAKSIERVADHVRRVATYVLERNPRIDRDVLTLLEDIRNLFEEVCRAFIELNKFKALEIAKRVDEMRNQIKRIESLRDPLLEPLADALRRILAYSIDIAETILDLIALNEALEKRFGTSNKVV